ncbi:MAG: carbamoyltransferase, partial [Gammaproteobacteria bacterium]|nr:carbamoyltransferase [Gammaproteobacteria bacterium]
MSLVVLGLSGALTHDPSAAIYVDGELIAAAEEERFTRQKHAKNAMPLHAARYVLREANLKAKDVDVVAFPFGKVSLFGKARWHYAKRHWYAPDRALDAIFNGNRHYRRNVKKVRELLLALGINWADIEF